MKATAKVITLLMALTAASQGVTTISGTLGSQFKGNDLATNIPSGSLVLLLADTGTAGFLASPGLAAKSGTTIEVANAGITVGSIFAGDTVINTSVAGSGGSIAGLLPGIDVTSYLDKSFAVVWFNQTPAALTTSVSGAYFGMISLADWVIPSDADGKTYTLSSTDAAGGTSFYSTSTATTATQLGETGFVTGSGIAGVTTDIIKGATFQVVPEPSAALLGAFGVLGLLRRRRI